MFLETWNMNLIWLLVLLAGRAKTPKSPLIGPFINKLHLADNSIDLFENGSDIEESLNTVHQTIETFAKYTFKHRNSVDRH